MNSTTLLQAEGLKKAFDGQVVFDALDLELSQGEVALLRGENGSGKTTLLNILTGNLEPDAGTLHYLASKIPRTYRFPRGWWQDINPLDHFTPEFVAREGVSRTWQDVRLFNAQSLRDNIAVAEQGHPGENPLIALFAPRLSSRREKRIHQEADAMLARLGLAGREQSSADMISLGQSKRVAIARSVSAGARILFLDEPLAGLDRQGIQDVLQLLESLVKKEQITLVIIEHLFNQRHLEGLITTDWLLENGQIQGSAVRNPRTEHYPRATAGSAALQGGSLRDSASDARLPSQQYATSKTQRPPWFQLLTGNDNGVDVVDEPLPRGALLTRIRRPGAYKGPSSPILEIRELVIERGRRLVIGLDAEGEATGLDLTLYQGETAILQAPNGWGKSTLIAALAGFIPVQKGVIRLQGNLLDGLPSWDRVRAGLRVLPSDRFIFPDLSGSEALKLSGSAASPTNTFTVEPPSLLDRKYASLSGGERRQIALAGFHGGILGLCDEPFDALDGETTRRAVEYLLAAMGTLFIALPYREGTQ
uniref:ABC-type branched-chain amino acid transport system, ATPase component n=1 Tax=Candidatus Kentrum eta TaxID=2126337 RepID=A0A450URM4_9GAMM|nr:MAG: ABC-type branched-chain amino acid transport system, ATPase component [Candidatus Kentron sp. H]VFJ88878.1 MAG: ABC-type branched-chain amino acid transport system, ATPase component [Candidatus Kentron sp. H]VFJ95120.1 MAG: ABC-type branched-chain amino acid transport system, ATPase component [Candidatus Kentron sp. H]